MREVSPAAMLATPPREYGPPSEPYEADREAAGPMEVIRNRRESWPGPAEMFTGNVWIEQLAISDSVGVHTLKVRFTPGARTAWHSHPRGQILHVVDGVGRTQERGGALTEMRQGDSVIT